MRPASRLPDRLLRLVVLTAAALIPVVFYLKAYEVFNDTKSWTLRVFGMLAGVLLLVRDEPIRSKGLPGALAFLAAGALSMQHTPLLQASLERMSELLSFALLMVAVETGAVPVRALLACALWSFALVLTYASAQYFNYDVIGWTRFEPGHRVYSTMGNPDFLAAHTSILVPAMAGLLAAAIAAGRRAAAPTRAPAALPTWATLLGPGLYQSLRTLLIYLGPGCGVTAMSLAVFTVFHPLTETPDKHFNMILLGVAGAGFFIGGFIFKVNLADARNLLILLLALTLPSLIYTGARGALLAFLAAVLAVAALLRAWRMLMAVVAVIGILIGGTEAGRHMIDRMYELTDPVKSSSMQIRMFYWYSGWLMGRGEPTAPDRHGVHLPVGAGIGAFHLAGQRTQGRAMEIWNVKWPRAAEMVSPHLELYAHNDYVHLFAEIGPIGLGAYLWIMVTLLIGGLSRLFQGGVPPPGRYSLMTLVAGGACASAASLLPISPLLRMVLIVGCIGTWAVLIVRLYAWLLSPVYTMRPSSSLSPQPLSPSDRWILVGLIGATVAWYANSLFNFPLKVVQNAHLFFAVIVPALLAYCPFPVRTVQLRIPRAVVAALLLFVGWRIAAGGIRTMASHYLKFGHALTNQGGPDAALGLFSRAGRIASVHTDGILIHYYRGKANQAAGNLLEADGDFTRALAIFVNFPEGYQARGMVRLALAQQLLTGAAPSATAPATTADGHPTPRDAAGWLALAAEDLESSRFLNPKDTMTWLHTGYTKRAKGDHPGAIEAFRNAIRFSQDRWPEAYYDIALSNIELNRLSDARAALEEGFGKFPPQAFPPAATALRAKLARLPGAKLPSKR